MIWLVKTLIVDIFNTKIWQVFVKCGWPSYTTPTVRVTIVQCSWRHSLLIFGLPTYRCFTAGAIIGDGDRKRASFLVFRLAPWYETIFLFLEQIAPSPAAHAGTCCEDYRGCRAGKMASEIPEIVLCFSVLAHNSTSLWLLEFCFSSFVVSCSSLSEDSAEFRYVPLYIAEQVVFRCFFYKNFA